MPRRRRFTVGRAFALLILGIGIGAALYISRHLRPESLEREVQAALARLLLARHEFDDVRLGLDTGVEVIGVRAYYPDGTAAVEAERIVLTVDHRKLLGGEVVIRRVDFHGTTLRLRRAADGDGAPSLPGIFRPPETEADRFGPPAGMPHLEIHPGTGGSFLELLDLPALAPGVALRLRCRRAEARPDGPLYHLTAEFTGTRVELLRVDIMLNPDARALHIQAEAEKLTWAREDIALLHPRVRDFLPPVELKGEARAELTTVIDLARLAPATVTATASVSRLEGVFGNVYTGDAVGLPFGLREGKAEVRYKDGRVLVDDIQAVYVSPAGTHGRLLGSVALALDRVGTHLDVTLRGRGVEGSTEDLRHLLPPDVVESIVEQFLPGGTLDFDVSVSQRPAHEEKVVAELKVRNGTFDYAGNLDELTGRRFGFRYPLERCQGRFRIETHVPTARGLAEIIEVKELKGFSPIARPRAGGPADVAVAAEGRVTVYDLPDRSNREDIDIRIRVSDLPIDAKLARAFASTPEGLPYEAFDLTGWAKSVDIHVQRDGFREPRPRTSYDVTLERCSLAYREFPLRLHDLHGRIVSVDMPADERGRTSRILRLEELRGQAREGGEFRGSGEIRQFPKHPPEVQLDITAHRLKVGADLERALLQSAVAGTGVVDAWRSLRPAGFVSADVKIQDQRATIGIDLSELVLAGYEDIDCPLTHLDGRITYEAGAVTLENVSGRIFGDATFHVGGAFRPDGSLELKGEVDQLVLRGAVQRILKAVAPQASDAVARLELAPESTFDVILSCRRVGPDTPLEFACTLDELDVKSRFLGLDIAVAGGPITIGLEELSGRDLWLSAGLARIHVVDARVPHDPALPRWVVVDARDLEPEGHLAHLLGQDVRDVLGRNLRVDLTGLRAEYDPKGHTVALSGALDLRRHELLEAEEGALEPTGQVGFSPLTLRLPRRQGEPLRFSGVVDFKDLNLNLPVNARNLAGQVRVAEGTLSPEFTVSGAVTGGRATVFDRVLERMSLNLTYDPRRLHLGHIDGRCYEGDFKGSVEVHLREPRAFRVHLRADGVALGEMLKEDLPRSEPMTGTLSMVIEIESPNGEPEHMRGQAQVRVVDGQLFRVPGLRRILSVLARVTPIKGKRFDRAEGDFTIRGEDIVVDRFHFATDLNDVRGQGTISIYGDLDLVVEPQVTRAIDLPRLFNVPVLSSLLNIWHSTVYEIRLEGTLDSPALRLRGLPFIKRNRPRFTQTPHAGRAERIRPRLLP